MSLQIRGVTYDVGTTTLEGALTRESLLPEQVEQEMKVISQDLHCTAVRITGRDINRLKLAATSAMQQGLDVWLSPALHNAKEQETLDYMVEAAHLAEELRLHQQSANIALVIGCELSLFMSGLLPGDTMLDRLAAMTDLSRWTPEFFALGSPQERFQAFLSRAVTEVRRHFHGPVTYASGMWEEIDWTPFDIVGVDAYRDAANADDFRESVRAYLKFGKPCVATEFGCCTYVGAEQKGGMGWAVIDRKASPWQLHEGIVRDEEVQAQYLTEMLQLFEEEGFSGAFVFTFVSPSYPSSDEPQFDLDTASYSLVRTWPSAEGAGAREPKLAFHAVAKYYGK